MKEENYTSLELSKKLAENGCELKSNYYYNHYGNKNFEAGWDLCQSKLPVHHELGIYDKSIPAYDILWDVCVKYAKEFFGTGKMLCHECSSEEFSCKCKSYHSLDFAHRAHVVLTYILKGDKQDAEKYIWDNCVFNPKNKGGVA